MECAPHPKCQEAGFIKPFQPNLKETVENSLKLNDFPQLSSWMLNFTYNPVRGPSENYQRLAVAPVEATELACRQKNYSLEIFDPTVESLLFA